MLFQLRLTRRVELRTRWMREHELLYGIEYAPLVLQRSEIVDVLDVEEGGFYCMTRHGKAFLAPDTLKPVVRRAST